MEQVRPPSIDKSKQTDPGSQRHSQSLSQSYMTPGQCTDHSREIEQRAERGTHNDRWNCNSGAERIRLQDRYFNVGYTPSHDDRHYLRYDCHYSRDDRSSSQNCSSANYSPPVKDNIPKCYCYRIDIDFSNEQHAWRNSPYHNYGRNHSPSPYAPLQPKYSSNGREHYIITEKAPKDIHIKVYTQQVKVENR